MKKFVTAQFLMTCVMLMFAAINTHAQVTFMNIHKTDGTAQKIRTEEVDSITFEEVTKSATVYYGCTDDIPTSVTEQGTPVDIYGNAAEVEFYAKGHCAWVAVPEYGESIVLHQTSVGGWEIVGFTTIRVMGYIVYYLIRGDEKDLDNTFKAIVQKTDTPVTPTQTLIYYGSSSTVPNTLSDMTAHTATIPTTITLDASGVKCVYAAFDPNNVNIESFKEQLLGMNGDILNQFTLNGTMTGYKTISGYKIYYRYEPVNTLSATYQIKLVKK